MFIMYIMPLVLTYLIIETLYLLNAFIQFLLPPSAACGNHKSDLFLLEFVFKYNWTLR